MIFLSGIPENLNYESKEEYDRLTEHTIFGGKDSGIDVFMLALAIGFKEGQKKKLKEKKPNLRLRTRGEDFFWKVRPLAIVKKGSVDPLLDEEKVFSEAEESANFGVKVLLKLLFEPGKKRIDEQTKLMEEIDLLAES